jgi:fatty acid desaturase
METLHRDFLLVQVTRPVLALSFKIPKFGTWQRYILSDVEPIMAMMDPPSSFIFGNIPFHLKHHLLLKPKHFCFLKQD